MQTQNDIHHEFHAAVTPDQAFAAIANVKGWWIRDTEGPAANVGDRFTVYFNREQDFVRFSITGAQPGRRVVWHVDDCYLHWFSDKTEWNGTDVIFEISPSSGGCSVSLVHRGITPEVECYSVCNPGWEGHFMKSLYKLMTAGAGDPQ